MHDILKSHIALGRTTSNDKNSVPFWNSYVLGQDVSAMFNRAQDAKTWSAYCDIRLTGPPLNLYPAIQPSSGWYAHSDVPGNTASLQKYIRRGGVIWDVDTLAKGINDQSNPKRYLTAYNNIYDVTALHEPGIKTALLGQYFQNVSNLYSATPGYDTTSLFEYLKKKDPQQYANVKKCLDNIFLIGQVDHRKDPQCITTNWILLGASCILVAVIGFKFLAALQFYGAKAPEGHEKFVICQVPCYTEGEDSIRRTIESLAVMGYDDKHKLLFIVCDGMIIGAGNDRPTPRIVLDILGVDPSIEPESFSFQSLGDGNNQLNLGKVYSGLYEISGHVVPYIVVVKVGKQSEQGRPGNR